MRGYVYPALALGAIVGCLAMLALDPEPEPVIPIIPPPARADWNEYDFEAAGPVVVRLMNEDEWIALIQRNAEELR
jgi:hypothetical protein